MDMFTDYLERKIAELKAEAAELEKSYRQDDAVFVKIRINVYDVCKTVFGVFKKVKPEDSLYNEYIKKLDEFENTWSDSAKKANEFGDLKKIAAEEAKLVALADIKSKFIELRGNEMQEEAALKLFKCLGDKSRLNILKILAKEESYVELLAEKLNITPATVSFHLKKLEDAGAVSSHKEQYYNIYTLNKEIFSSSIISIINEAPSEEDEQQKREEAYRKKVIENFFEYGKLKLIPSQRKKERICLEEIAKEFETGIDYPEKEVNEVIMKYNDDYCTIRRDMISEGIIKRNGTVYRKK